MNDRKRWEAILGPTKIADKLGRLFDVSPKHMYKWEGGEWPLYTRRLLEFMEQTPEKNWPAAIRRSVSEPISQ